MTPVASPPTPITRAAILLGAAHPGPTVVVTTIACLLAVGSGLSPGRIALVTLAVLTGQLSIGWGNDLVDVTRDRDSGRRDKPLATGRVSATAVRRACAVALLLTVVLSLLCGLLPGVTQLVVVASGWAYNLGLKATAWSWLPYAVAFGALPAFVSLAGGSAPIAVAVLAGSMLGVGAHFLNVLPDLDDDAATGVRGLPHRIDRRLVAPAGMALLALASLLLVTRSNAAAWVVGVTVVAVVALVAVGLGGSGRTPFRAAMALAVLDVALLTGTL